METSDSRKLIKLDFNPVFSSGLSANQPKEFDYLLQELKITKFYFPLKRKTFYLTKREAECLYYLVRAKTAKEIALLLNISPRTVESYIDTLKMKLECNSKIDLVLRSQEARPFWLFYDANN